MRKKHKTMVCPLTFGSCQSYLLLASSTTTTSTTTKTWGQYLQSITARNVVPNIRRCMIVSTSQHTHTHTHTYKLVCKFAESEQSNLIESMNRKNWLILNKEENHFSLFLSFSVDRTSSSWSNFVYSYDQLWHVIEGKK